MKIRQVGAELFYADRQTDRQTDCRQTDKYYGAHSLFLQFPNAPKNLNGLIWTGYVAGMVGIEKHTHL
jgi:hypothetical protein